MKAFEKWLLVASSALTGASGVVYWWMKHALEPAEPWAAINHPLQPIALKLHILVAPVLVFAVGLIATDHIWAHFRRSVRLGRRSGLTTMWVLVPMVLSGYLIQAVTGETLLRALVWAHVGTGLVYLAGLGVHSRVFRRRQAARERAGGGRWEALAVVEDVEPRVGVSGRERAGGACAPSEGGGAPGRGTHVAT